MTALHEGCDYCPTSFACGRLYAALHIAEARPETARSMRLARTLAALRARLAELGWSYPYGDAPCDLVSEDHDVQRMTQELIEAMHTDARTPDEKKEERHRE